MITKERIAELRDLLTQNEARYIAPAINALPELLDEIERLRGIIKANDDVIRNEREWLQKIWSEP